MRPALSRRLVYVLWFAACFLVRLVPFRPPNIEPLLAIQAPFARAYGPAAAFFFGCASIVVFDAATVGLGIWTFVAASAYGLLGLWARFYLKRRSNRPSAYVTFAIMATIAYDALTGLSIGPLFFGQSVAAALAGQIPFTAMHLLGNLLLCAVLSPALYRLVAGSEAARSYYVSAHPHIA